ncbi:unnamed protein product, partial [Polarella glacialis]
MALPMKAMKAAMKAVKAKAMKKVMKKATKAKAMKKAMKKVMKKAMKKKAMKVSKIAKGKLAKLVVFKGGKEKTATGLKKSDLMKNKTGRVVTRSRHAAGKKAYAHIKAWTTACQKARKDLGIKGFVPIKKGTAFYKAAKAIYTEQDVGQPLFTGPLSDSRSVVIHGWLEAAEQLVCVVRLQPVLRQTLQSCVDCPIFAVQPPLDLVIEAISALIRDSGDQVAVGQSILLSALSNALSNPFLGMAFDIMPAGRPFIAEVTTLASTTADTLWLPFDGREEESEARAGALQAARSCVAQFRGILNTGSAQTDAPSFPSALLALLALPGVPRAAASLDLATPPEELFANGGVAALLWAYECSLRRPVQDAVPKLADAAAADEPRLGSLSPALTAPTPAPAVAQKVEGQKEVASPLTNVLAPATQPAVIFPPNGALTVPVAAVMLPPTGALTSPVAA